VRQTLLPELDDVVLEQMRFQTLERHRTQEARGNDAIRVDVVAAERQPRACDSDDALNRHKRNP
jgi:hypothetical protein